MKTIRSRLLASMMITGLVPLVLVLGPLGTALNRGLRQQEEAQLAHTARQLGRLVAEVTDRTAKELGSLQSNPLLSDPGNGLEEKLLEMNRLVGIFDLYTDISLYDGEGYLLGSTAEEHPAFRDYSEWFREALAGKVIISHPQRVIGKEGLHFTVYLPVLPGDREGAGPAVPGEVIKARLSFARVLSLLQGVEVGKTGSVYLIDGWGNTLSGRDPSHLLEKFDSRVSPAKWVIDPSGSYTSPGGESFLYASEVLNSSITNVDTHWIVLALKPMREVNAVARQAALALVVAAACMALVASGLGFYLAKRISRPLESIGEVARQVAAGDLSIRAGGDGGSSEIQDLAGSFNQMIAELADHREGLERLVVSRTESLRRSQTELEQAGATLRAAIESTNNGFLVEDSAGEIAVANDLFLALLGLDPEAFAGREADEALAAFSELGALSPDEDGRWREARKAGGVIDREVTLALVPPRILHVHSAPVTDPRGQVVGRVWNTRDLTEQRQLEEGLRQSQKMEAVGQLAGGVAHDFNNLLAGILGNLSLLRMDAETVLGREGEENLAHAVKAGERAADLVRQLLGFSRRSRMDLRPCQANQVLAEVRGILSATLDRRIVIEMDLEESLWGVMADVGLLSQVVMNMAVNAKDAMPGGGRLWLRSANRSFDREELRGHPEASPGDYICLSVEDQGEGIPLEVQAKIFEPFFTTKAPGKGTGLGLATSFGIVKQLGGWIDFASRPGEGTRFDIFLPRSAAAEMQPDPSLLAGEAAAPLAVSARGGELILVVDDEDVVRRIARSLLSKLGYQILEARDGLEAVEICRQQGQAIDLVLLDLTMPNLSGKETFALIRDSLPGLPVLICSGHLVDLNEFAARGGSCPDGFVQKPYRFEDMSEAVRRVLDESRRAA